MFSRRTSAQSSRASELGAEMDRVKGARHVPRVSMRRFEGAAIDRLTASWLTTNAAIDDELKSQLGALCARSRDMFKNNPYCAKFGRMVRNNVVGAEGFTLQMRVMDDAGRPDAAANQAIEAAFVRWQRPRNCDVTGRRSFVDIVRLAVTALCRDGEFLIRKVRGRNRGAFGFQLQPLDVTRLDVTLNREATEGNNAIVMGVEMDAYRTPVAYHIWTAAAAVGRSTRQRERVPASEIIHQFMPMEEEQTRGVPWLHAAMRMFNDLHGYREAAVIAARIGASKMGFYTSPDGNVPPSASEQDDEGNFVRSATPGEFEVLPIGYDFKSFDPAYPHEQFDSFCKAALRGAASGIGVAYHTLANDLEGVNFSSIRAGVLEEREEWMSVQNWLTNALLVVVFEEWLESSLMKAAIRLPNGSALPASKLDRFMEHGWQGRRWPWVDPLKDMQASVLAIENFLASPQQIAAQAGRDVEDILDDIAAFQALALTNAGTLSGLITQLSSRVRQFFTDVSNRGPLDYFKSQLRGMIDTVDRLARSNELEAWARRLGATIVSVSSAVADAARFVVDYAGALVLLAKGYAAIKVGNFLVDLAATTRGAAGAAGGVSSLGKTLRSLPGGIKIAIALIGLDLAVKGATALGDAIGRNLPATKAWEERARTLNEETRASAERYRAATAELDRYRAVQVKSADAVGVMTTAERQRYNEGLTGLQAYLKAQVVYYNTLDKIGQLNDEGRQHLADLRARLAEVENSFKTLQSTAAAAVDQFGGLSEGARLLVKQFDAVGTSAKGIGAELGKAFAQLDTDSVTKVGDIGLALVQVAKESESAATAVRGGLAIALRELSSTELLKFQSSAVAAFDAAKLSAKDTAAVLDATLLVALEKLDVAPAKFGMGMTQAGTQAVAAFATVTENARATAAQIEAAFVAATRAANSREDLEALGAALKAAADQGRISFEAAERATLALKNRMRELRAEADPLGDAYARLGIQSQQALDDARDSAREAFDAIVVGARRGIAAQADVQRAFDAYAAAARAAAEDSTQAVREQVEAHLRAQAVALGLRDALNEAGTAGANAGNATADAADAAAEALGNLAGAADDAASGADSLSDSGDRAASSLDRVAASGAGAAFALNDVSAAFAQVANGANGLDRIAFGELARQREQAEALLTTLREQNAAYDERAARIENLRRQFNYLGDETLARLADEQRQLDENIQRREEEARRRREEQQRDGGQSSGGGGRVQLELVHTVKAEGRGSLTQQEFDGLLQEAGRSGKLGRFFNDSLRRAMTNAGAGNGR